MADVLTQAQIDEMLKNVAAGAVPEVTQKEEEKVKEYDFRAPKKFTKEQIKVLDGIFENYARLLSSYLTGLLRLYCRVSLVNIEDRFWDLFNGGKIQYVRYPIDYNKGAVETLVRRAMNKGFYEGVNLSLAYCDDCGYQQLEMDVCPKCGSTNLTKIDRMNGYLSYSRVKGDTRLNAAKMAEIADRKSM